MLKNILGQRLHDLRNARGITQKQVAEKFGITTIGYQQCERGRRNPSLKTLINLADFFDVSTDYLAGRTDNPTVNR